MTLGILSFPYPKEASRLPCSTTYRTVRQQTTTSISCASLSPSLPSNRSHLSNLDLRLLDATGCLEKGKTNSPKWWFNVVGDESHGAICAIRRKSPNKTHPSQTGRKFSPIRLTSNDWWHILDSTWACQESLGRMTCPSPFLTQFRHFLDGLLTFLYKVSSVKLNHFGVNSICFLLSFTNRFYEIL